MAGLSVLLETHESESVKAQVISKATLHSPKVSSSPARAAATTSSFLQRCSLCHKELTVDNDIYMYRGDRAFCSVECRCRQIFMDEQDAGSSYCGANGAATARSSRRATASDGSGGGGGGGGSISFAY